MATLTAETRTTLGAAALVATSFIGGAWWIEDSLDAVEKAQAKTQSEQAVTRVETKAEFDKIDLRLKSIEHSSDDRWRRSDMRAYIREANAGGAKLPPID